MAGEVREEPSTSDDGRRRKRIRQACDNCKRKKDRCDGQRPSCALCHRKKHACHYSNTTAKDLCPRAWNCSPPSTSLRAAVAPIPRTARFISDSSGRYNYIGDSASLSFLQSAKLVVTAALGECTFTQEDMPASTRPAAQMEPLELTSNEVSAMIPDEAERLAHEYLAATGCLLDLFDAKELVDDVRTWATMQGSPPRMHESLILLVLAIGMQMDSARRADPHSQARLVERGRQLVYSLTVDEPSIVIVQAFALISLYLSSDSRANPAFMNLGIAIRAAETLGLHKVERQCFSQQAASVRERTWRSIRVLDIFLSASTGRPPATSETDLPESGITDIIGHPADHAFARATLGLCDIGEKILVEVYQKRSLSTVCVEDISQHIRDCVHTLPEMPAALVMQTTSTEHLDLARAMASAHLMGAYYWAIILLTRPFLLFHASMRQTKGSVVETIAETCITAAINGLDLVEDILARERLPRRLPVVLNSVLNCALAVGIAVFADYDDDFPLSSNLLRAISALKRIGQEDSTALQHLSIVESFAAATEQYKSQRQSQTMKKKGRQLDTLFGSMNSRFISTASANHSDRTRPTTSPVAQQHSDALFDPLWFEDEFATLFPSGLLIGRSNRQSPVVYAARRVTF